MRTLSLIILLGFFFVTSCKKKTSMIGSNSIDGSELLYGNVVDTFSLSTYTEFEDSVITSTSSTGLLGSYNDPKFGEVNASFFTQFRLPSTNPNFGDINAITIDSFVLGLKYEGAYGSFEPQTFEVHELSDTLDLNTYYYSFSDKTVASTNLIDPNKATLTPSPVNKIYIDTVAHDSQLRLFLDTNFARNLMLEANSGGTSFSSNDEFVKYFKGLKVSANNSFSSGQGAVLYFALNDASSKLTIYYKQDGINKTFNFLINSSSAKFSQVTIENSGKPVSDVVSNHALGQTNFYAQALKSRAVIDIPGIKNLPKNIVIHEATLTLPVQYELNELYTAGSNVSIATNLEKASSLYNIGTGVLDETKLEYTLDVKSFVQSILTDERYPVTIDNTNENLLIEGTKLYVYPRYFNSTLNRIVFNGSNTITGNKPKLVIKYTEF